MIPLWWQGDIAPGDSGARVLIVQKMLGAWPSGVFDNNTSAAVRGFQVGRGLEPCGWVCEETAIALGPRESDGQLPGWWTGEPVKEGEDGFDALVKPWGGADGLRRLQGNHGIPATGVIDEQTARLLNALTV